MGTEDDMPGSHAANQSKTESMPPSQGHADPDAAPEPATVEVPSLDSMSVGAGDPQAPSHAAAGDRGDRSNSGVPALDTREDAPVPDVVLASGNDEQMETDVDRSAARTSVAGQDGSPGDAKGVPAVSGQGAPGSSEKSGVAEGTRTPR
ncbi:MAG: hypothetical protein NVS3B26_00790 [Mycobacteriales bacterium]